MCLAWFVIGIAGSTMFLYLKGHPERSAWTGVVPQSTPSAAADILLSISMLMTIWLVVRPDD